MRSRRRHRRRGCADLVHQVLLPARAGPARCARPGGRARAGRPRGRRSMMASSRLPLPHVAAWRCSGRQAATLLRRHHSHDIRQPRRVASTATSLYPRPADQRPRDPYPSVTTRWCGGSSTYSGICDADRAGARTTGVVSWAHSAIAVSVRAPASTAQTPLSRSARRPMPDTAAQWWISDRAQHVRKINRHQV
jgi:hypothetical protein